jgi:hypothetical protein
MATDTRSGFRLPWSSDRPDESPSEEGHDPDAWPAADLDRKPPQGTTDRSRMTGSGTRAAQSDGRASRFRADLTAAMRTAAQVASAQAIEQLQDEAKGVGEQIHAGSSGEAAALRKQAEYDLAEVRDWSKAEIARIREETEARLAERKAGLDAELEAHAAAIETRIEQVQGAVATFERDMAAFLDRLMAETDPTRFATMFEMLPEAPSLASVLPELGLDADGDEQDNRAALAAGRIDEPDAEPAGSTDDAAGGYGDGLGDGDVDRSSIMAALEAAAEAVVAAEAAAESANQAEAAADVAETAAELLSGKIGHEDEDEDEPTDSDTALAARLDAGGRDAGTSFTDRLAALLAGRGDIALNEAGTTHVVVTGLVSVASIASFKRHLGRVSGVRTVTVSSGPEGEFVFSVAHGADVTFRDVVPSLPGFGARITGTGDGYIQVTARDPEGEA